MTDLWLATALSVASALISVVVSLIAFWFGRRSVKEAASAVSFEKAFSSFDLKVIGEYLRSEFGSVALDTYARDENVRRSLDRSLARIGEFLDADEQGASSKADARDEEPELVEVVGDREFASELNEKPGDAPAVLAALEQLRKGEIWNALAKLRRDVEIDIRQVFGESRAIPINSVIVRMEMPKDVADALKRFYRTASMAVHGDDVTFGQAVEAVNNARRFYRHLETIRNAQF